MPLLFSSLPLFCYRCLYRCWRRRCFSRCVSCCSRRRCVLCCHARCYPCPCHHRCCYVVLVVVISAFILVLVFALLLLLSLLALFSLLRCLGLSRRWRRYSYRQWHRCCWSIVIVVALSSLPLISALPLLSSSFFFLLSHLTSKRIFLLATKTQSFV